MLISLYLSTLEQMLDILNFLGGVTRSDSFLRAYKIAEAKYSFPYELFDDQEKLTNTQLPPYEAFFYRQRNSYPLEKDFSDFQS